MYNNKDCSICGELAPITRYTEADVKKALYIAGIHPQLKARIIRELQKISLTTDCNKCNI